MSAADRDREVRALLRNISVCYFLSGGLGLIYQILWLRKLLLIFGSTVHAVSTILTVFFGGLALGSWLFGRLIDRHEGAGLRWYALLEALVGLYALITLPLFDGMQHVYIPLYRASGFSPAALVGWSFVCSVVVLLIPTTLLGGTFPVLSRFLIHSAEERGVRIASLYGINTAGAMTGTLLVYSFGLPVLGLFRTLLCAAVLNLGIGALCLAFDRHLEQLGFGAVKKVPTPSPTAASQPEERPGALRWLLLAFALSGFSAMVYEVAWTRALSLVLGSSIYAFCVMLATFLAGMAAGSFAARQGLRARAATTGQVILIEVLLGVYGLLSIPLFSTLPDWFVTLWPVTRQSFNGLVWLQVTLSACVMALPTFFMGLLFPIVSDLVTRRLAQLGQRLGAAYAINTLGGIVGSFLSGFVLIPAFGLPWAIAAAAVVNLAAAAVVYGRFGRWRAVLPRVAVSGALLAAACVVSGMVVVPSWQRKVFSAGVYLSPEAFQGQSIRQAVTETKLLYYRDSLNATVSVQQQGETISLKVGGKTDASNGLDMSTQALSAHIPLLLHQDPKRVLVIGLGSGVTLGHAGRHDVSTLHCAEIDPAVIEGARFFKAHNYNVHEDPRATMFAVDGRNFLLASQEQYDVIISEPSNPWMAGLAYLFTREYYQLVKRRLAPGGVMCQWLQLYRIFPGDVKLLLKTFHHEFPHVTVWSSLPGDLLVIGSMEPLQFAGDRLARRMAVPAVNEALEVVRVTRPEVLLQLFWFGNRQVEQLTADITMLHEDDMPWVEFNAPKALYLDPALVMNSAGLAQFKTGPQEVAPAYQSSAEDASFYRDVAAMWNVRLEPRKAKEALERAVARDPSSAETRVLLAQHYLVDGEHLRASEALTKATELAPADPEAYRWLGRLHLRQGQLGQAQRFYEQGARLRVPDGLFAEELGDCMRAAGRLKAAAEYYRSAVSLDGGERLPLVLAYTQVLKDLKQWQEAQVLLQFGRRTFPQQAVLPELLGQVFIEEGQWQEAESAFRQAIALNPKSAQAYYGLARIAISRGDTAQALRSVRRGLRYLPYHREALELLHQLTTPS